MFGVPGPTEFDVRFRLLGVPVRVHPLFWVLATLLGWDLTRGGGKLLVVWIGCVFLSILVHEFGHALTARAFGARPEVMLYSLGGLCLYQNSRETLWKRFFVLAMGPGAGFLLMGAAIAWGSVRFHVSPLDVWNGEFIPGSGLVGAAIYFLVMINFFWGIFNLLPVMPLDGGQIATVFLSMHNRREGQRRAYIVSLVVSGLVALYFVRREQYFNALLFGMLALMSFQILQALHDRARFGSALEDDADWWKR
jgi:membrane-associated protease RseP (regulator of RpoE activity)